MGAFAPWRELMESISGEAEVWRVKRKRATFTEIEVFVEEQSDRLRKRMIEDLAQFEDPDEGAQRPSCSACGGELAWHGKRERELTTMRGSTVRLSRSIGVCKGCGSSLFPPG